MSYDDMVSFLCHILVSHVCETAVVQLPGTISYHGENRWH